MLQRFQEQQTSKSERVKIVSLDDTVENIKQETVIED